MDLLHQHLPASPGLLKAARVCGRAGGEDIEDVEDFLRTLCRPLYICLVVVSGHHFCELLLCYLDKHLE